MNKVNKELKELLESLNKNLIKSDKRDLLVIRSEKHLKNIIKKKLGHEDDELKCLINRVENLVDILTSKLGGMRDFENFLCSDWQYKRKD